MPHVVLSIAGSDPSGGAGLQADLKTIEALGGRAATVVTAVTAQRVGRVTGVWPMPVSLVARQAALVFDALPVAAVKTGMLATGPIVRAVAAAIRDRDGRPLVVDPVLRSSSGARLLDDDGLVALCERLLPLAALVTPNAGEAEALTGLEVRDVDGARRAARRLVELGARAAVVTGGHLVDGRGTDVLVGPDGERLFEAESFDTGPAHGSGCVFASTAAMRLAEGHGLERAVLDAKRVTAASIRAGRRAAGGHEAVDPTRGVARAGSSASPP